MRDQAGEQNLTTMTQFNRQYLLLGVLVVAGIGGSFYTSVGGDPRIGAFSAGITIGLLYAFYILRTAENRLYGLEVPEYSVSDELQDDDQLEEYNLEATLPIELQTEVPEINRLEALVEEGTLDSGQNQIEIPDEESSYEEDASPGTPGAEREYSGDLAVCSCICGCQLRSISSEVNLCGNCDRWWIQQSEKCTCDYSSQAYCTCGKIKHGQAAELASVLQ